MLVWVYQSCRHSGLGHRETAKNVNCFLPNRGASKFILSLIQYKWYKPIKCITGISQALDCNGAFSCNFMKLCHNFLIFKNKPDTFPLYYMVMILVCYYCLEHSIDRALEIG